VVASSLKGTGTGAELRLSHSPTAVAVARSGSELSVAFDFDLTEAGLGYPIDIEELPDGRIVVLDRESPGFLYFDQAGRLLGRAGREGEGPGELRSPVGITRAGGYLVVTGAQKDRTLMTADSSGRPLRHYGPPVPGDWSRATQRPPSDGTDTPWYPAAEDVALRLVTFDDSSVAVIVAANEWETTADSSDTQRLPPRPVAVIRISANSGKVIETLWRGLTPSATRDQSRADLMPSWPFPRFAALPLVASGAGWVAVTDGASGEIVIVGGSGVGRVRWEPRGLEVTDAIKERRFEWIVRQQSRTIGHWAEWWDSLGAASRADAKRAELQRYPWAERVPEVTAMLGSGRCLWISGFSIEDGPLGVGRSWVVVDVVEGALVGTFRVTSEWTRLRSVGGRGVYGTYRDEEGSSHLVRLSIPTGAEGCSTPVVLAE
jgi:hypothetical protein